MEKYQIKVNSKIIDADHLSFEYSQLDSESTGRSEDGTMFRDVIGLTNKIYAKFDYKQGDELSSLLNLIELTSATVTYNDPRGGEVTKNMYITCDKVDILLINGEYVAEPFEIRFIQMDVDNL